LIAARLVQAVKIMIQATSGAVKSSGENTGALDDRSFFSSVAVPAAPRCEIPTAPGLILLMKSLIICLAALCLASIALAQDKTQLKDQKDKASYSIGYDIGSTFKKQKVDLNADALFTGLKDALSGKEALLSKEDREKTLEVFQKEMMEKQVAASKEAATKNAAEGEKFLAENKTKDGVKTTTSGLQYKVLKEGSGEPPKETDTVVTNYRGTLLDGTEFDSSYKRNEPASFPVNRVIKGWTEALQLMKPGAKYQLFIPSALAYGERGAGRDIGPNATLIFEVELLSVKPPEPATTVAPGASAPPTPNKNAPTSSVTPPAKPVASPSPSAKPAASPSPSAKPK
jgi:FKBP-type peptidyl-prolyl cis-trans isomerase FklB